MPLSRWTVICPGLCRLVSYSSGFARLTKHPEPLLQTCFTCVQLYPPKLYARTPYFFSLVSSGRVESFAMRTLLQRPDGTFIEAVEILKVEFENDKPVSVICCLKPFDETSAAVKDLDYLQPFLVKIYNPTNSSNAIEDTKATPPPSSGSSMEHYLPPAAVPQKAFDAYNSQISPIRESPPLCYNSASYSPPCGLDSSPSAGTYIGNLKNYQSPPRNNSTEDSRHSDSWRSSSANRNSVDSLFCDQDFTSQSALFEFSNSGGTGRGNNAPSQKPIL